MFGYISVKILMFTWSVTIAESNGIRQEFQKTLPDANLNTFGDDFMNGTGSIMSLYGEVIRGLLWKKLVVFHDQSREKELKVLLGSLETGSSGFSPSMLKFEISHSFWGSFEEDIAHVHKLLFPRIHIVVLCHERNTVQLISQVMSVELKPRSLLDYRHNSYWLVFSDAKWVDRIKGLSAPMENVAIIPVQQGKGNRNAPIHAEADICVSHIYVIPERQKDLDFITPAFDIREYFILYRRNSRTVFSIFRFLEPFKMEVYIVLLSTLIIVPLMCFLAELIITGAPPDNISEVFFYFCASLLQQGGRLKPVTWTARAITATFWLCSICLAASYSAHLTASLTVTENVQPFTNIRELLQRSDYKVGISVIGPVMTALKTSKSGLHNELWERISDDSHNDPSIIGDNMTNQMEKVLKGNYAVLVKDIFANRAVAIDCRVDYLKEIVAWNHLPFAVWKKSPYENDLDKVMGRIVDSDFLQRYKEKHIKKQYNNSKLCEPIPRTTVSAEYMVGILSCLGIGFGASTFLILVEILYVKFKVASSISFLIDKVKVAK